MHIRITLVRDGRTLATGAAHGTGRDLRWSREGPRLASLQAAMAGFMPQRAVGGAIESISNAAWGRDVSWRHREDEPMLRDEIRLNWAPGATRMWREEEKWLPKGSTTLLVEIMTDAAAALDVQMAA